MRTTAPNPAPGGQATTDTAIRQLAAAVLALRAAAREVGALDLDAASSATALGLLEHGQRTIGYVQLQATFHAHATGIHRLDPDTASAIDALTAQPQALADGTATTPLERFVTGMAAHRNTAEYLRAHLHISAAEARRRLSGARLLIAPATPASPVANPADATPETAETADTADAAENPDAADDPASAGAPSFPVLARTAAEGSADVGNLSQLAERLESLQPRIAERPDAANLNIAIEEDLAHEARTAQPSSCFKALADWTTFLAENGAPITDEEIRAKRGMIYRGYRDGCDEYTLRCDPRDSETIRSFAEAWTNPRSGRFPPRSISTTAPTHTGKGATPHTRSGATPGASPSTIPDVTPDTGVADNPQTPIASPDSPSGTPSGTPAGTPAGTPSGTPAGTPAPEWAVPTGTDPAQAPVSELDCGVPAERTGAPGTAELAENGRDIRTNPQLLLDAVLAAISGAFTGSPPLQSGGMPVKIGVLIGYRALLGQCEDAGITAHGLPISASTIRRMACNGDLLPAVLGTDGEILDLGREVRGFSPAQRKAIAIRDRGCSIPGCHRPASTSELHHVESWADGGATSIANGACLCSWHHLQVHAGLITLGMINGIPYVIARKGQPRGDPERNLYWHPELRTTGYTPPLFA